METPVIPGDRSILSTAMTVNAMRDARYGHPAKAIAELIDNSIDAFATRVDLMVEEHQVEVSTRSRWRVRSLAVLDNGIGMDEETLGQALRFGGRVPGRGVRKIGKYGMGLPTASASQCKRLDVWSWQDDPANAHHAYLDINEIRSGNQQRIETERQSPPQEWLSRSRIDTSMSGTLIVWSDIDRITQRAQTVFSHFGEEIGRTYRHYIHDDSVQIRMISYRDGIPTTDSPVRPNDPLYLMAPSTTPAPWHDRALFRHLPDLDNTYTISVDGREETVQVRYSMVKDEPAAIGENRRALPGNTDYGHHARRNMGVSIVREDREIILDDNCVDTAGGGGIYPYNRWWGCEVRFNAGLDDLFGVDHNKQMVAHFSQLLKQAALSRAELLLEAEDELDSQADPLAKIAVDIRRNISGLMRQIAHMFRRRNPVNEGTRGKLTPTQRAEKTATDATEESLRNQETLGTATDEAFVNIAPNEKEAEITKAYVEAGYDETRAKEEAALTVNSGNRYRFMDDTLPGHYVFQAKPTGGILIVKLNVNHRFHQYLDALEEDVDTDGNEASEMAAVGLRLAILALARLDDEFTDRDAKLRFQENCERWGRMLDRIITEGATYAVE